MKKANPEQYAATITLRMSEEERHKIKLLAVHEKTTIKAILFKALANTFPSWKEEEKK